VDRLAAVVVLVFAGLLTAAVAPGSFYGDDLPRMSEAAREGLTWDYLGSEVFGHLAPGYRLVFWLQVQIAPLHHGATALVTVLGQSAVVGGFWLLLRRLVGPRPGALVPLVVLAFTPISVPGILWWSSAVNLIPAQLAIITAMYAHLEVLRGRVRARFVVQAAILLGLLFWEKTALLLLELPLLTATLGGGGFRERALRVARQWRLWITYSHPVWVFLLVFFVAGYGAPTRAVPPADLARHVATTAADGLATGLLGGPYQWSRVGTYFSVAGPRPWLVGTASMLLVAYLVWCVWRNGSRAVAATLLLVVPLVASAVSTAFSRYAYFGLQVARDYRYLADLVIPVVLALTLAALPAKDPGDVPAAAPTQRHGRRPDRRLSSIAIPVALLLFVCGSVLSTWRYARVWHENPVGDYLATARSSLAVAPGDPPRALLDTEVPDFVLDPVYRPDTFVSRVLAPLRAPPTFDSAGGALHVLDESGRYTPAAVERVASSGPGPNGDCGWWAPDGDVTVPLSPEAPSGDWLVTIYYLANGDTPAAVSTRAGRERSDVFSSSEPPRLANGLGTLFVHAPGRAIAAIQLDGLKKDVCVISAEVSRVAADVAP
jgi:hypothetical protein